MERILVVEDDSRLGEHVCGLVQSAGFVPRLVSRMSELDLCFVEKPTLHAIILDRLVGGQDTKARVADLKKRWPLTPILVLSAINTPLERAELLNLGADDYLGKPFLSQELLARVRALTRRFHGVQTNYREIGDLILDIPKRLLIFGDKQDQLPAKEFLLIKILSDEIARVISKNELLDVVWGGGLDVETNVVEATVANLRRRMAGLGATVEIRNSRNIGYWIEE
ncbi:MAG: response regulator transcription factor [Bdellovibrionales bacterium]|nr:response regulator transcription factor [Bdellovibrionales bacterium]